MLKHHSLWYPSPLSLVNLSIPNGDLQVFELIDRGVSTSQIAEQLNLSTKTIETHQEHIKKKLGLGSAHELNQRAIRWVMDQGS